MKICLIAPKAYQLFNSEVKSTFGGAEVQLSLLAKELAKRDGLDVHFMVADFGQKDIEIRENVKLWKSLDFKTFLLRQIFDFFTVFNRVNAEIYVQRTLTPFSGLIALFCKIRRKKFVYMVAADDETDGTNVLYQGFFGRISARLVFTKSNIIFVQNYYEGEQLAKHFNVKKRVLLKKGVELTSIAADRSLGKQYDGIWVGRCEERKRPQIFIQLAKENPEKAFVMICPKATGHENFFETTKKEAQGCININFVEFAKNKEIYSYLLASRVFCFTSTTEGDWPMTVLEAATSGLPILSYSLNYDLLINQYNGGVLYDGDFDRMKSDFSRLTEDSYALRIMGNNARRYIMENHEIKANTTEFIQALSQLKQ